MSDVDADALWCRAMVMMAAEYFDHKNNGTWVGIPATKTIEPFDPDSFMKEQFAVFGERLKERGLWDALPDYVKATQL